VRSPVNWHALNREWLMRPLSSVASRRHDVVRLVLLAGLLATPSPVKPSLEAQPRSNQPDKGTSSTHTESTAALAGFVRDTIGRGIAYANIYIDSTSVATISDDSGHFKLEGVPVGVRRFVAHRVGYDAVAFEIDMPAALTVNVDIRLRSTVASVVETTASDAGPVARLITSGFYERMRLGLGYFLAPGDLSKRSGYTNLAFVLKDAPGIRAERRDDGQGFTITGRNSCLNFFVDDVQVKEFPAELMPSGLFAVEVYSDFASSPPRYRANNPRECGSVVFWTRR
jgi:hypothetical protein